METNEETLLKRSKDAAKGRKKKKRMMIAESIFAVSSGFYNKRGTFRLDYQAYIDFARVMEHSIILRIITDKLWVLINPAGIDLVLKIKEKTHPARPQFVKNVLNSRWSIFLESFLRHRLAFGFVVVAYIPVLTRPHIVSALTMRDLQRAEEYAAEEGANDEIVLEPVVIPPNHYILEWTYDVYGRRVYNILPLRIPTALSVGQTGMVTDFGCFGISDMLLGEREFANADIFVYDPPSDLLQICSPMRDAIQYVLAVDQILENFKTITTSQANLPLVVETKPDSRGGSGGMLSQERTMGLSVKTDPSASRAQVAEDVLQMDLARHATSKMHANQTNSTLVENAVQAAKETTIATTVQYFDSVRGRILSTAPLQPWERSLYTLPEGCTVGRIDSIEPPKILTQVVSTYVAYIVSACGLPIELVLGAFGKDIRISATDMAKDNLDAAIKGTRNLLSRVMTQIFWRIYGRRMHTIASVCVSAGKKVQNIVRRSADPLDTGFAEFDEYDDDYDLDDSIDQLYELMEVEFIFLQKETTWREAYEMFQLHLIKKPAVLDRLRNQCPDIPEKFLDHSTEYEDAVALRMTTATRNVKPPKTITSTSSTATNSASKKPK